ncbi:MAG TPA: right-handed parallel beta-helix repeat-containing protein [Candidatus Hydrogenedentes bacterium]|nr:right-handed parallel beta-helix repeat-containing protein [Candidatus Hydrogenedentota bacterium]
MIKQACLILGVILFLGISASAFSEESAAQLIERVKKGELMEANAAWWGFNAEDSTDSLQAAIDSGAKKLVIPRMDSEWVVRPLHLRSNLEVVFEPGAVVLAKRGEYKNTGDSLFSANDCTDIVLRGFGAVLRMNKVDYQSAAYKKGEWRMVLDIQGCTNVLIEGLRLESSGGDGIYIGSTGKQEFCKNVVIRDAICDDHHRQGISIISAIDLLIERTLMLNTSGTAPQAGIDFEPNRPTEQLTNCIMRDCVLENNTGGNILFYLKQLSKESPPLSVIVENCIVRNGVDAGVAVGMLDDDAPKGSIEFRKCTIENPGRAGAFVFDKSAESAVVRFTQCTWHNAWVGKEIKSDTPRVPLLLTVMHPKQCTKFGGIVFEDCQVYDTADRPVLKVETVRRGLGIHGLHGTLTVHNPNGARVDLGKDPVDVDLRLVEVRE